MGFELIAAMMLTRTLLAASLSSSDCHMLVRIDRREQI